MYEGIEYIELPEVAVVVEAAAEIANALASEKRQKIVFLMGGEPTLPYSPGGLTVERGGVVTLTVFDNWVRDPRCGEAECLQALQDAEWYLTTPAVIAKDMLNGGPAPYPGEAVHGNSR